MLYYKCFRGGILITNKWEYDSLIQELYWQETKLKRINNTKEYLNIIKPPFYTLKKRKKWKYRFDTLLEEEKEILNLLFILYRELEKIL